MSGTSAFYVGIDGGGTKTALIAAPRQKEAPEVLTGPQTNVQVVGIPGVVERLANLIEECQRLFPARPIGGVCAGLAGAGRPNEQKKVARRLAQRLQLASDKVQVLADADIAVEAAFEGGSGVVVMAGTGSMICGRSQAGSFAYAGGWGRLLGDEGSGYALGQRGLQAVAAALDGGPSTSLIGHVKQQLGAASKAALVRRVYQEDWPLQQFAPHVLKAAEAGDVEALRILKEETTALVKRLQWLAAANPKAYTRQVAFIGGLTKASIYQKHLTDAVHRMLPAWKVRPAAHPPVKGAWRIAAGIDANNQS